MHIYIILTVFTDIQTLYLLNQCKKTMQRILQALCLWKKYAKHIIWSRLNQQNPLASIYLWENWGLRKLKTHFWSESDTRPVCCSYFSAPVLINYGWLLFVTHRCKKLNLMQSVPSHFLLTETVNYLWERPKVRGKLTTVVWGFVYVLCPLNRVI